MRRNLQILAATAALLGTGLWAGLGARRGWTQTSLPVKTVDEITGIEAISYHPGFRPGIDFLGAAWLGAVALGSVSLLFHKTAAKQTTVDSHQPATR